MSSESVKCIGPIGPTGPGGASYADYEGTGFFGPGFANAGTTTPDTLPIGNTISLLREPNTYYPTQFGLGIYDGMNYQDVVMIGNHSDVTGPNSAQGAVALGNLTGQINQDNDAIAIGYQAGYWGQQSTAIAIGMSSGYNIQGEGGVAIGYSAGFDRSYGVSIGSYSGYAEQAPTAIAIGIASGALGQGFGAIGIGSNAQTYSFGDNTNSIAIGYNTGNTSQYANAVAIGNLAGNENQGEESIAIGDNAGATNQSSGAVAIGYFAGNTQQGSSISIGYMAAESNQDNNSVAIGDDAARYDQGSTSVAIGLNAAYNNQGNNAVAIGKQAGFLNQGDYAVALGNFAGPNNQAANSIVINATGSDLENTVANSCVIAPIRNVTGSTDPYLFYDDTTGEVTYGIPPSSRDRKTDIQPILYDVVDKILQLSPVSFNYKDSERKTFGLVAEQVYEILPEICIHHSVTGELDGIEYTELIGPMIKLIQLNDTLLKENDILLDKISCH